MIRSTLLAAALSLAAVCGARADGEHADSGHNAPKVTVVFDHELPNVPGKSMRGILVEYPAGGASVGHTHPKSAFIYATVLEGSIRTSVNDGPEKVYKAGENFPEFPGDRHTLDENASQTEPAKLLAVFVVNTEDKELLTPLKK